MALVTEVSTNPTIAANAGTLAAGAANTFRPLLNGYIGTVEDKAQLVQAHLERENLYQGFGAIGGGAVSAGSGLNALVAAATAVVGNIVRTDASSTVSVTASSTNYIYMRQNGTFEANTAGTVPGTADGKGTALFWGQAVTNGSGVTSVSNARQEWRWMTSAPQTTTAAAGAGTINGMRGIVTTEALTTAAGSDYTLGLINSNIAATSIVHVSADDGTNTTAPVYVRKITPAAGSVTIYVRNGHASSALNGTLKLSFTVN
jgi:hypothetical protein